ncbi:MAG: hypothetical protein ACT4PJ_15260 [Gemmatimonadaceae bacterium]
MRFLALVVGGGAACASPSSRNDNGFSEAPHYTPGTSYFGRNDYIEYSAGQLPIIITAPHGGALRPAEIADRTYRTTVTDLNTTELARAIDSAFVRRTGKPVHVIMVHLHRTKLDANRDITEAAQGDAEAETAWRDFHRFVNDAKEAVDRDHEAGFYIDLHGHGRTLSVHSPLSFSELLRGPVSLGTLFEREGVPAVPSDATPNPGSDPFFGGGLHSADGSSLATPWYGS